MNTAAEPTVPNANHALILKAAASIGMVGGGARSAPQIVAELCREDANPEQVAALLGREPALCVRVLRVANSAYFGQTRSISTIDRALAVLGHDAVRGIAAAACLDRTIVKGGSGSGVEMRAVMLHSQATAVAASALARVTKPELASEAFMAGLLHNLGIAVQIQLESEKMKLIVELRRVGDIRPIRALEAELAAIGHEECAAALFEAWQLPPGLIESVRYHHDPISAPVEFRVLASLVALGARLAITAGKTHALETVPSDQHEDAIALLGLAEGEYLQASAVVLDRLEALGTTLSGE